MARVSCRKWKLYKQEPKLKPGAPYSARLPITEKDKKEYYKSLKYKRNLMKRPRTLYADIPPRFDQLPDSDNHDSLRLHQNKITIKKWSCLYCIIKW